MYSDTGFFLYFNFVDFLANSVIIVAVFVKVMILVLITGS